MKQKAEDNHRIAKSKGLKPCSDKKNKKRMQAKKSCVGNFKRYSRQIQYRGFSEEKQIALKDSVAAVIGIGGLGSVASEILVRAGIGKLIVIDGDKVELSNLQRQALFTESSIGKSKAEEAKKALKKINSHVEIEALPYMLKKSNLGKIAKATIVLDCTDSIKSRKLIAEYCSEAKKPWVFCTVASDFGFLKLIAAKEDGLSFIKRIYKKAKTGLTSESSGIMPGLTYFAASIQATTAIKAITENKQQLKESELIMLSLSPIMIRKLKLS